MQSNCQRDHLLGISSAEAVNVFTNQEPQIVELAMIRRCSGSVILPTASKIDWLPRAGRKQTARKAQAVAARKSAAQSAEEICRPQTGPMPIRLNRLAPMQSQKSNGTRRAA